MTVSSVMSCPRCGVGLHVGQTRVGVMYGCSLCGGIWLDRAMSERLTNALDSDTLALADAASHHARARAETSTAALPCPICSAVLSRHSVTNARVELDSCSTHGTWFDRDELQKVARAFAAARAYGAPSGVGRAAIAGAALGTGAVALAAGSEPIAQRIRSNEQGSESALEAGGEVLEAGAEVAGSAGDLAEGTAGALELAGGAFEVLGGILEGLG